MKHKFAAILLGAALAGVSAPAMAQGQWKVAETKHLIYYSQAPEAELRESVEQLEIFDRLVRALTNNTREAKPTKLTMFEVNAIDDVGRTLPYPVGGVAGYYNSTEKGPFLVTFRKDLSSDRRSTRRTDTWRIPLGPEVRQHEYVHHYMYQFFNTNYPTWYSEGFAEYFGTLQFKPNNVVELGHAPWGRIDAIRSGSWLPVRKLLTARSYGDVSDIGALYAQGWLLTHLSIQNKERGQQLQAYLNAVASGTDYTKAANDAFGDLNKLDDDLRKHLRGFNAMTLSLKPQDIGAVNVRTLSPIEQKMMRHRIRLYSGYERSDLALVVRSARADVAAHPGEYAGLVVLAQLELLDRQYAAALRTADAALVAKPGDQEALVAKGRAMAGLLTPQSDAGAWDSAREPIRAAIAASASNTEARLALFETYLDQQVQPTDEAQNRLVEAFNQLPQNDDIRYLLARDFERRGHVEDAIAVISPAAFGIADAGEHVAKKRRRDLSRAADRYTGIRFTETPREMLERLQAKEDGRWDEATQTARPAAPATAAGG